MGTVEGRGSPGGEHEPRLIVWPAEAGASDRHFVSVPHCQGARGHCEPPSYLEPFHSLGVWEEARPPWSALCPLVLVDEKPRVCVSCLPWEAALGCTLASMWELSGLGPSLSPSVPPPSSGSGRPGTSSGFMPWARTGEQSWEAGSIMVVTLKSYALLFDFIRNKPDILISDISPRYWAQVPVMSMSVLHPLKSGEAASNIELGGI